MGLYSSAIYHLPASTIPLLRDKIEYALQHSGFVKGGYNIKKLRAILEYLPREILFQSSKHSLSDIALFVLSSMVTKKLKIFVSDRKNDGFINILVFIEHQRLTPNAHHAIQEYLKEFFKANISYSYTTDVQHNFCYMYVALAPSKTATTKIDINKMEEDIDKLSSQWKDALLREVKRAYNTKYIPFSSYCEIFPKNYQQRFGTFDALQDIQNIHKLRSDSIEYAFKLQRVENGKYILKIYSKNPETLSNLLPLIENLGFSALNEETFELFNNSWIYAFDLAIDSSIHDDQMISNVETALYKMKTGQLESDSLCKLVALAAFNWREVFMLKALTRYLHQTGFAYGKGYVQFTLVKHYEYTKTIIDLCNARFNPQNISAELQKKYRERIEKYLNTVQTSSEDKVLRSIFALCNAIVRTNNYHNKSYISFKFASSLVPDLPSPVPYAEIFVYGRDFEGIHLRGGKIARGGIRWSDRGEDYRTEILGLMKAQMTKNAVIVPVGSKGGFVIKFTQGTLERSQYMQKVIERYQTFLRGLLDLTDNIVDGKIIKPSDMMVYDQDDPYLVVAADKGTASFSDYANQVSQEYNFWLGDAFASGGSAGYDHKKMAITARGAWISVKDHFASIGVDVQKDQIRVIGIGDMAGDVFGNGMLLSNTTKLVGAFNHMHIFLDPDPDPKISFHERQRLFSLPTSQWTDYNPKIISKGGGIFPRAAKTVSLTKEMKKLLNTTEKSLEPDQVIRLMLMAEVDLIWNGGIGTYVKATHEADADIGDRTNDNLRCNGSEIKAKVIGEGGNLGLSQQGRIEYARSGGHINTDFIDNSAGVDCSDHEVNIKIALNHALAKNILNIDQRNRLLTQMQSQVAELVLADNFKQNQALTIMTQSSAFTVEIFSRFIEELEEDKLLDRKVEFLPSNTELKRRIASGEKMTRPELSVLLSYSKMSLYKELINSTIADDVYFEQWLLSYFPQEMQDQFKKEILAHHLRREIILTMITNKIVNQLGGPIISTLQRETGAKLCNIVRSYIIINDIFNIEDAWIKVEKLPHEIGMNIKVEMFTDLAKILRRGISWFLRHLDHPIHIGDAIAYYKKPAEVLRDTLTQFISGDIRDKFDSRKEYYVENHVPKSLASNIAIMDCLVSVFDILLVSKNTKAKDSDVAKIYFDVSDRFSLDWLRKCAEKQIDDSYWNRLAIQALKDDLYDKQRRLVAKITSDLRASGDTSLWYEQNATDTRTFMDFISDLKEQENVNLNMVLLANKHFEILLCKM